MKVTPAGALMHQVQTRPKSAAFVFHEEVWTYERLAVEAETDQALAEHGIGMPTMAASLTAGCEATSASSTSTREMLVPPRMMMSFLRDTNHSSPPSPRRIRSPV